MKMNLGELDLICQSISILGLSLVTNNLVKRDAGFVVVRLLAPLQLLPSMVVLRNLSQSRSRSLIAVFSIQPHMYVRLIRSTSKTTSS